MKRATKIDAHVGKKIKLRRINLGLSQQELSKLLNLSFQQVQKYENSINRVSSGRLYDFSKALRVPVRYFFEGIEDNDSNEKYKDINYDNLNKEILIISRLLSGIDSEAKKQNLIETIKNMIKFMK